MLGPDADLAPRIGNGAAGRTKTEQISLISAYMQVFRVGMRVEYLVNQIFHKPHSLGFPWADHGVAVADFAESGESWMLKREFEMPQGLHQRNDFQVAARRFRKQ